MNSTSYKTALGGVVCSFCLMLMFMTSVSSVLYLVMPMLAGMLMIVIINESGSRWAFMTYISVSILSMLVTFNKESALMFIIFFGHYPILKQYIERITIGIFRKILKVGIFNICIISELAITVYVFGITDIIEEMNDFGRYGLWIMLFISNIMFISYDIALRNCTIIYKKWLRPRILYKK